MQPSNITSNYNPSLPPVTPVNPSPPPPKVKVESQSSLWGMFKNALGGTAHYAVRGAIWAFCYNCDFDRLHHQYLKEVQNTVGEEGYADMEAMADFFAASIDIEALLESKCQEETWYPFAKDLVAAEKERIHKTIHSTILGAMVHLATFANKQFPHEILEGKSTPQDFFCKVLVRTLDQAGVNLSGIHEIAAIENKEERETQLLDLFRKTSRQVFDTVFPQGTHEIEIPKLAQWYLEQRWNAMIDETIPEKLLQMYLATQQPHEMKQLKATLGQLPNGQAVLDFTHQLGKKIADSSWEYLAEHPVLGTDWNYLGNAFQQFFKPDFGWQFKKEEKIGQILKQLENLSENFSTFSKQLLERQEEAILHISQMKIFLSQATTQLKIEEEKELINQAQTLLSRLQETIQVNGMDSPLTLEFIRAEGIEKFEQLAKELKVIQGRYQAVEGKIQELIHREEQTKGWLEKAAEALVAKIFTHLASQWDGKNGTFTAFVYKKFIDVIEKKLKEIPSSNTLQLKEEVKSINEKLQATENRIAKKIEEIKQQGAVIKALRSQIKEAAGDVSRLPSLFEEEKEALERKAQLMSEKNQLYSEKNVLIKNKQDKIQNIFDPTAQEIMELIGYSTPQSLPADEILQPILHSIIKAQISNFFYENTHAFLELIGEKEKNQAALSVDPNTRSWISVIENLSKSLPQKIRSTLQHTEDSYDLVKEVLINNNLHLQPSTIGWMLKGTDDYMKGRDSEELWDSIEKITESLFLSISHTLSTLHPNQPLIPLLLEQTLTIFEQFFSKIPEAKIQEILQLPPNEEQKQKISDLFTPMAQALCSQLGYKDLNELPIPDLLRDTVIHQVNTQLFQLYVAYEKILRGTQETLSKVSYDNPPVAPSVVESLAQKLIAMARKTLTAPESKNIENQIKKFIPDPTFASWLTKGIQTVAISPSSTSAVINKTWSEVTVALESLLKDTFNKITAQTPQLRGTGAEGADPKMLMKMATYAFELVTFYFDSIQLATQHIAFRRAMDIDTFSDKLTKEILDFALPQGVQGLPLSEEAKKFLLEKKEENPESVMDMIQATIKETLKDYVAMVMDPKERTKLLEKGLEKIYTSLPSKEEGHKAPKDPKKLIMETCDLAIKWAFSAAWKQVQELPNEKIGKIFGERALKGKQALDRITNALFGFMFAFLSLTILYPIVALVKYIWHAQTAKISKEILRLVEMPENTPFFQNLALEMIGMLKKGPPLRQNAPDIDKEFLNSAIQLCQQFSQFDFGVVSVGLNLFSRKAGQIIVDLAVPKLGANALETLIEKV